MGVNTAPYVSMTDCPVDLRYRRAVAVPRRARYEGQTRSARTARQQPHGLLCADRASVGLARLDPPLGRRPRLAWRREWPPRTALGPQNLRLHARQRRGTTHEVRRGN